MDLPGVKADLHEKPTQTKLLAWLRLTNPFTWRDRHMKRLTLVCTLILLASPALHAQQDPQEQQPNSPSQYNIQQNELRREQHAFDTIQQNDLTYSIKSLATMNKLRAKLAEAWQTLGMSPQAAQTVAAAYQPQLAENVNHHHPSLRGKSDEEVAAMLQSALSSKNYILADQLLIDRQREQLRLGKSVSPDGHY
jgi:hypothetical protein